MIVSARGGIWWPRRVQECVGMAYTLAITFAFVYCSLPVTYGQLGHMVWGHKTIMAGV